MLWRAGWVLVLTALWSPGRVDMSSLVDLVAAVVLVAVCSVILWRAKNIYRSGKQAAKAAWSEGQRKAVRHIVRMLVNLRD